MTLLLLLAGCACPTFDEIEVIEGEGAAAGTGDVVRAAVAEFASWTSREGVCVADITLEPVEDEPHGQTEGRHLAISPDSPEIERVTRHELCHAWDREEGRPSVENTDLFPPEEAPDFDDDDLAAQEVFAEQCASGPRDVDELTALFDDLCGDGTSGADLSPAETWLRDNVFDAYEEPIDAPVGIAAFSVERFDLEVVDGNGATGAVYSGEGLVVLEQVVDSGIRVAFDVLFVDPATGATIRRPTPIPGDAPYSGILASDGSPIVWMRKGDAPVAAWRVPREGEILPVALATLPETVSMVGYAWGDQLLVQVTTPTSSTVQRTDLLTGQGHPIGLPDGMSPPLLGVEGTGGDRIVVYGADALLVYSTTTDGWDAAYERPAAWPYDIGELPDGRLVGLVSRGIDEGVALPIVLDPEDGRMTFPEGGCAQADAGFYGRMIVADGAARVLARSHLTGPFEELLVVTP